MVSNANSGSSRRSDWLLIETFGWPKDHPSIVNWGGRPRMFLPLKTGLRGTHHRVEQAIATVARSGEPLSATARGLHVEVVPHILQGRLHGIQYWSGGSDDPVPPRPSAGSWWIDYTAKRALGSPEWAEMADIPPEHRGQVRSLANMFAQVSTDSRESVTLRNAVQPKPGLTNQGVWVVKRRDGHTFHSHWSTRYYPIQMDGEMHDVAIGISQEVQVGPDGDPEPVVLLEHKLLESTMDPGQYRAIFDLTSLTLIRWAHGSPIPDQISWQGVHQEASPGVHPDDRHIMFEMAKGLRRSSTTGTLRLRGVDGSWIRIEAKANLIAIESQVTAGLLQFTITGLE